MRFWLNAYGVLGAGSTLAWVALFMAGSTQSQLVEAFVKPPGPADARQFVLLCLLWSPTNAALLTCLAGLTGGSLRYLTDPPSLGGMVNARGPLAAVMRSFIIYLAVIAGLAIAAPEGSLVPANPNPAQHQRFACMVSLLGFAVGYEPKFIGKLIDKIPVIG